ncbi:Arm DNA-binding domain-containing protein [Geomonas sp. Red276]
MWLRLLTYSQIKNAQRKDKKYSLSDKNGLQLVVAPSGSMIWQVRYKYAGRRTSLSLGPFPLVSLDEARNMTHVIRRMLCGNNDPHQRFSRRRVIYKGIQRLSNSQIQNAQSKDKEYSMSDGDCLLLIVAPSGRKIWRVRYQYGGRRTSLSIGIFPVVSVGHARVVRDKVKMMLLHNIDPGRQMAHRQKLLQ